jgi:hypothetical protein
VKRSAPRGADLLDALQPIADHIRRWDYASFDQDD